MAIIKIVFKLPFRFASYGLNKSFWYQVPGG